MSEIFLKCHIYISGYDIKYKIFKNICKDLIQKLHNGQIFEFPLIFHSMTGIAHHLSSDVAKHLKYWVNGTFGKIGSYVTKVASPFKNKAYSIYNRNSLAFFQVKNFVHPEGLDNFFF